jgi:Cys-tRNA synthase (O-phospho-L-seryl-tRNA:Cys-tRNA synthase)
MKKKLGLAILLAVLMVAGAPTASAKTCKDEFVVGHGHRHMSAALARASAIRAWRTWADIKYGWRYRTWSRAAEQSFECSSPAGAPGLMECTARARPCRL